MKLGVLAFVALFQTCHTSEDGGMSQDEVFLLQKNAKINMAHERKEAQCTCQAHSVKWSRTSRRTPKCIFIDLGAANGDTFGKFIANGYGKVQNCANHSGQWEAFLLEANPYFAPALRGIAQNYSGKVHELSSSAAYMCEGFTSFSVAWDPKHNHWGSSMDSKSHKDDDWKHMNTIRSSPHQEGKTISNPAGNITMVTVPTVNVNKLIYENTIPDDYVIVKMDIEGAEFNVVPCLARSLASYNVDALYMERHPATWQVGDSTSAVEMENSLEVLRSRGVHMPVYFSPTL